MTVQPVAPRSWLFVPGSRPDRFAKALAAGADAVILDLEDAVGAQDKDHARDAVAAVVASGGLHHVRDGRAVPVVVRINSPVAAEGRADLTAVARAATTTASSVGALRAVLVPKCEDPQLLALVGDALPDTVPLIALVETAVGVLAARELAGVPRVERLALGGVDLSLDTDADPGDEQLAFARSQIVYASRAAGAGPPVDSPPTDLDDPAAVTRSARRAGRAGFSGVLCVHPRHVAAVHAGLSPTPDEVDRARRVLDGATDGGAVRVDGAMVDRPVIERAKLLIERVDRIAALEER